MAMYDMTYHIDDIYDMSMTFTVVFGVFFLVVAGDSPCNPSTCSQQTMLILDPECRIVDRTVLGNIWTPILPSGYVKIAMENGLPIKNSDFPKLY